MTELPASTDEDLVIGIRLELDGAEPPIWRELELSGNLTLDRVHALLQVAMGWEDYHLHRFWHGEYAYRPDEPVFVTEFDIAEGEEGFLESEVRLDQVLCESGDRIGYLYDFGDDWHHTLSVQHLQEATPEDDVGRCLDGAGACPPEDVGGIGQYNELRAGLRGDPEHAELAEEHREWLRPEFDPDRFVPEEATEHMADAAARASSVSALLESPNTALRTLAERLSGDAVTALAALFARAAEAPVPSADEMATAVRPWQVLLDAAGTEGIALTAAGWMKPAVVQQIAAELEIDRWWIGKVNREDLTAPVAGLRESAQQDLEGDAPISRPAVFQGIGATGGLLHVIESAFGDTFVSSPDPRGARVVRALAARAVRG